MKYFMDTEFAETGNEINPTIDLISIGIVCEDGRELYIENEDYDPSHGNTFVNTQVIPKLLGPKRSLAEISKRIVKFVGDDTPEFWAYYADYDWVVFCWMYGGMLELPDRFPKLCMDLQQWWIQLGRPDVKPKQEENVSHHALMDARWNYSFWRRLDSEVKNK